MIEYTGAPLWPLMAYAFAVFLIVFFMIAGSYFLGQRHSERLTGQPYESGIPPTGTARIRFDIKFYLVAMFFVIFDVEAAFIYAWAVSLHEVGWAGYIEIVVFIAILIAALVYLWRLGALDWGTVWRKRLSQSGRGRT